MYFDYWTVGIKNFKFFDQKLKEKGFSTKLVHLNSWKGIKEPNYQVIQGIDCYDIKHYNTNFIHKVLEQEKPLAVVMLNCSFMTDRTLILSCRKLGIKSVYLTHGSLIRDEFIEESIKAQNRSLKKNRLKKAIKHVNGTVLNYLNSIYKFNKSYIFRPHAYKVLIGSFTNPGKYLNFPPPSFDLKPDLAMVYGKLDREFYIKNFLLDPASVKVIGNPELDRYFQELPSLGDNKEQFLIENNIPASKPYITYVEEGLVEDKVWENEYRLQFFQQIIDVCSEAGFHLVIKLHPRTAKGPSRPSLDAMKNVTVIAETNFPKLIYFTEKCISHYSTTLVYPILLNKPILIPRWGQSEKLITLYSDKEVTFIPSLEDLKKKIVATEFAFDRKDYLEDHVPFTDGKTNERVANYITDLVIEHTN
jgi:hypothetical protein